MGNDDNNNNHNNNNSSHKLNATLNGKSENQMALLLTTTGMER